MIKLIVYTILFTQIIFVEVSVSQTDWIRKVRIGGNPLSIEAVDSIVNFAEETYVFGIEVDNDIPGRYVSFLDPTEKLEAIRKVSQKAHQKNNFTFVYIAGLECITDNADEKEHSFYKDHPDWVQRDIKGRPAIFGGEDAFWIDEGDEDVWISPYADEWREIYMKRVRQIAETGIDGIYVDIPYWMTHFEGWEDTWASFDDYTVAVFKDKTGIDAKGDIDLGNFEDPNFLKWVNFRISTLTDFMAEIDSQAKSVNPNCIVIAEVYPGLGEEVVRVGADVYQMYEVVDAIAHEYSEGEYYASDRAPLDWYNYILGMRTFRAFGAEKPSWMLSYSWNDSKEVSAFEAMKSLFASQIFTGTNPWDAKGYWMSSTNDAQTRKEVYKWIDENEDIFFSQRDPLSNIGVYFSPTTRNLFPEEYIESYFGITSLLTHNHIPFKIVTPRTLGNFDGDILIFSGIKAMDDSEISKIESLRMKNLKIVAEQRTGIYDTSRELRGNSPFEIKAEKDANSLLLLDKTIGMTYNELLDKEFNKYFNNSKDSSAFLDFSKDFFEKFSGFYNKTLPINIEAPIEIISFVEENDEYLSIYLLNMKEICEACEPDKKYDQISVSYNDSIGSEKVEILPYLGEEKTIIPNRIETGYKINLPKINRAAVIRIKK